MPPISTTGVAVTYLDSNKMIISPASGVTSGQYLSVEVDSQITCDNSPSGTAVRMYVHGFVRIG